MTSDDDEVTRGVTGAAVERVALATLIAVDVAMLVFVAARNRFNMNPDAVAYLQIGRHLVEGRLDLAINGYWGPLLSCLMASFLAFGVDPLVSARSVLVISGILFLLGAIALFRVLDFRRFTLIVLSLLVALASLSWSVDAITPDLLAAGLLLFACSRTFNTDWTSSRALQMTSGVAWGVAYMAKAIVLPIGVAVTIATGISAVFGGQRRQALHATIVSLGLIGITAAPWITILSIKYGKPTFSTTGAIAHALVGPPDVDRRNPLILGFKTPERGRLIVSEDPSFLPFRYWSPLHSLRYADYQFEICRRNAEVVVTRLESFDRFHLGFCSLIAAFCVILIRPGLSLRHRWLLASIPVAAAFLLYMPVWAYDPRYYYFAFPLAAAACAGVVRLFSRWRGAVPLGMMLVVLSFLFPIRDSVPLAVRGEEHHAVDVARAVAARLEHLGRAGPVAGIGDVDGSMAGLYVAFFLNRPWVGDEVQLSLADLRRSDARIYVRSRSDHQVITEIEHDGAFVSLDSTLSSQEVSPLVVFIRSNDVRRGATQPAK